MDPATENAPSRGLNTWLALGIAILGCMVLGSLSGLLSNSGPSPWYDALEKSTLTPPSWTFGVVWPLLYALMGTALWMIWRLPDSPARTNAMWLFAAQFIINLAWSPVFFGAELVLPALLVIGVLILVLGQTLRRFWALKPMAGLLLVPYLLWCAFAFYLNFVIYLKNPA